MRLTLLLIPLVGLSQALPANAQYMEDLNAAPRQAELNRQQMMAQRLPDIGRSYAIRVTTGAHTQQGFEQALTSKDSNLKHWTWIPVTSFDQAYIGRGKNLPPRPEHVYQSSKPNHINEASSERPAGSNPQPFHYVKPNHVALPTVDHGPIQVASRNHAYGDVTGTIKVPGNPSPSEPRTYSYKAPKHSSQTKTYGGSYSSVSGNLKPSTSSSYDSQSVKGRLLSPSHH